MATVAATAIQPHVRSRKKFWFFLVLFAVTAFVTYMKNADILKPTSDIAKHFAPGTMFLLPHALFASVAFVVGAFQFSNRLRARYLKVHRTMGYVYAVCVFIGAPLAIPLAAKVDTPSLVAASVVQAFGWMLCTGIALYCVRAGNVKEHRKWMMRGYPFAVVFTVARMIIPIPPILRMGFSGIEIVVWSTIFAAAFLPSVILEWAAIRSKPVAKVAVAAAAR